MGSRSSYYTPTLIIVYRWMKILEAASVFKRLFFSICQNAGHSSSVTCSSRSNWLENSSSSFFEGTFEEATVTLSEIENLKRSVPHFPFSHM